VQKRFRHFPKDDAGREIILSNFELMPPADLRAWKLHLIQSFKEGTNYDNKFRILTKDGTPPTLTMLRINSKAKKEPQTGKGCGKKTGKSRKVVSTTEEEVPTDVSPSENDSALELAPPPRRNPLRPAVQQGAKRLASLARAEAKDGPSSSTRAPATPQKPRPKPKPAAPFQTDGKEHKERREGKNDESHHIHKSPFFQLRSMETTTLTPSMRKASYSSAAVSRLSFCFIWQHCRGLRAISCWTVGVNAQLELHIHVFQLELHPPTPTVVAYDCDSGRTLV